MTEMKLLNKFPARTGLILLAIFFVVSVVVVLKYVESERQRDLAHWQSRLGMLADLRRTAVENELHIRRETLRDLAENPSLQLYLAQYINNAGNDDLILAAQQSHVRNLLAATADRLGLKTRQENSINLAARSDYGIAVVNQTGTLLIASKGFPANISMLNNDIKTSLQSASIVLVDLFNSDSGQPVYGYIMPVFQLQGRQATGAVIITLDPRQGLFNQLENSHLDTRSDETLLLRKDNNTLAFISPLQNDFELFHQLPDNVQLAEIAGWKQSGGFIRGTDYRGIEVLLTTRSIASTPWTIVQKIDAAEALAESDQHQRFLLTGLLLLTGLICASFIAIWRHSSSVKLQHLTASLEAQTALLNAVSDNIHEMIFLLDKNKRFIFANPSLARTLGVQSQEIVGSSLNNVLGTDSAQILENMHHNLGNDADSPDIASLTIADTTSTYHITSAVLPRGQYQHATLYVLHDISELKSAQDKRDRLARGIIATLVKAVDLHDPYCVDHSSRTREVALSIAAELSLEKSRREALEMAALLANIGKLFLPREILTKMEPLSESENEMLKWHIEYTVDILKQLDFEGPVVKIISQKNEHLDGSGYPRGLQAPDILTESRILAVANAFVAMASARAYREGRPINEVLSILLQQCDQHYDRHVVAALFHIAENKADWRSWQTAAPPLNKH